MVEVRQIFFSFFELGDFGKVQLNFDPQLPHVKKGDDNEPTLLNEIRWKAYSTVPDIQFPIGRKYG